jgi:hypothetical protein
MSRIDSLASQEHLVVGVTDPQAEQHALPAAVIQAFVACEQQLADPLERIVLAASMPRKVRGFWCTRRRSLSKQRFPTRTT